MYFDDEVLLKSSPMEVGEGRSVSFPCIPPTTKSDPEMPRKLVLDDSMAWHREPGQYLWAQMCGIMWQPADSTRTAHRAHTCRFNHDSRLVVLNLSILWTSSSV